MKLPNKLFSYSESIINKFPIILNILEKEELTVYELYIKVINKFAGITEFIETLECLFVLGKIEYNYISRRVYYAI
ncbi:ABC-three component system middle component 7 [Clostridium sp. LP20]|uniref:ABC-three component system middle component 7 n=1 Tax=Clostridium sp. LP20 TaxID=3418665 RepID=UPI003EE5E21D